MQALTRWVVDELGFADSLLAPASADASFRRYFRLTRGADSYIVMDAPPDKEDLAPFLAVGRTLSDIGVNVPTVLARNIDSGFLLLSDLGTRQYLDALRSGSAAAGGDVDGLYAEATRALLTIQSADPQFGAYLPRYTPALLTREMELMPEWFLQRHLGLKLTAAVRSMLDDLFAALVQAAGRQTACIVHRDYHSRNLLATPRASPGILDFQDAVWGPITYDLVSLLKDCYIAWPAARVRHWALRHRDSLLTHYPGIGDEREFMRGFDLIGLQRHIKVLGIFARLHYRDGKPQYLHDLPRVLNYVTETAAGYAETAPFAAYIAEHVDPGFGAAQRRALE